jgi:predicted nucleic acid-binding protein
VRVLVDTNVLFPFSIMDLMLALSEDAVVEVIWTNALLAEWERVIVREDRRSADSAASVTAAIREFFSESQILEKQYVPLLQSMPGSDPDDRVHMAAAVAGEARTIVTWNESDFPAEPLAVKGVRVCDPDTYLCDLLDELPHEVTQTVVRLADEKRQPREHRATWRWYLARLACGGLPRGSKSSSVARDAIRVLPCDCFEPHSLHRSRSAACRIST